MASSRLQCLPAWQRHDAHHHFLVLAAACWLHGPFHDLVQRRVLRSPPVFLRVCLSASLPLDLVASLVIHFTRCQFLSLSQDTSWRVVCGVSRHRIESHLLLLLLLLLVFSPQATTTCPGQAARRSFHLWACSSLAPSSFEHAIVVQPPKITNFASDTPWVPLWRPCLRTLIMEMSLFVSAARVSTTPVTCCCSKSVWTSFTLPPSHSLKWASTINTLLLPLATLLTIEGSQEVTRGARCAQAHKEKPTDSGVICERPTQVRRSPRNDLVWCEGLCNGENSACFVSSFLSMHTCVDSLPSLLSKEARARRGPKAATQPARQPAQQDADLMSWRWGLD